MLWRYTSVLFAFAGLFILACKPEIQSPERSAEIFLEIASAAEKDQYLDLHTVLITRLCDQDQQTLQNRLDSFIQQLPSGDKTPNSFNKADIISTIKVPPNLAFEKVRLLEMTGLTARVQVPGNEKNKDTKPIMLTMVLEEEKWKVCNLVNP